MKVIIGTIFTWPKVSKGGRIPTAMMECPVISQPFEVIALDIVGPLPIGKGGMCFILTSCCMDTRWPDAVPLKTATAREVADACIVLFSRMGLPLQILIDQGS